MRYLLLVCISAIISIGVSAQKIEKDFDFKGFTSINVSGGFDLYISQGDDESVKLILDRELEKYLVVEIKGDALKIKLKSHIKFGLFKKSTPLKAIVVVKDIKSIYVSGGGNINTNKLISKNLRIGLSGGGDLNIDTSVDKLFCEISGGGDMIVKGDANSQEISLSGGGNLNSQIDAKVSKLHLSGGGDASIYCNNSVSLKAYLSGGGDVKLKGTVKVLEAGLSGGGDIYAKECQIDNCVLSLSGGGDASIMVRNSLDVSVSGGGSVKCYGKPYKLSKKLSGGSEVNIIQ